MNNHNIKTNPNNNKNENSLNKEGLENWESFYFKFFEFKEEFMHQLSANADILEDFLDKATILQNFHNIFLNCEKNRTIMQTNMENLHTKFLIDYQEKITKIDLINTQLDAIKKSVNAFNKKKKFYLENIEMQKAEEHSQKKNLQWMRQKIANKKQLVTETEEKINRLKAENKGLYNLELDLINKILQLEKKVGEIAQNKNSMASNITKLKDEIAYINQKAESQQKLKNKIIANNEKKNLILSREVYNIKSQISHISTKLRTYYFNIYLSDSKELKNEQIMNKIIAQYTEQFNKNKLIYSLEAFYNILDTRYTEKMASTSGKIQEMEMKNSQIKNLNHETQNKFFAAFERFKHSMLTEPLFADLWEKIKEKIKNSNSSNSTNFFASLYASGCFTMKNNDLEDYLGALDYRLRSTEALGGVQNTSASIENFTQFLNNYFINDDASASVIKKTVNQCNCEIEEEVKQAKNKLDSDKVFIKVIEKQIENSYRLKMQNKQIRQ